MRALYDEKGLEGLEDALGEGKVKHPEMNVESIIEVTLEDLFNGAPRTISIERTRTCSGCEGKGGPEGAAVTCTVCKGKGARMGTQMIAPGFYTQVPMRCDACDGMGEAVPEELKCVVCQGKGVKKEDIELQVHVEKGMKEGNVIRVAEEGHQVPGTLPGDVILHVKEAKHEPFERRGVNLIYKKHLNLTEALCGFSFPIQHLDGRILKCTSGAGEVIKQGQVKVIHQEGMPLRRNPMERGDLYITFEIDLPGDGTFSADQIELLLAILPAKPEYPEGGEEVELHAGPAAADDIEAGEFGDAEDEDGEGGDPRAAQCCVM